jgi:hypothetical protein
MTGLTVRNPVATRARAASPISPRRRDLAGVTLGLWWNKKFGGDIGLERLAETFARRFDSRVHREYHPFPGPRSAIEQMAEAAGAVVGATGD